MKCKNYNPKSFYKGQANIYACYYNPLIRYSVNDDYKERVPAQHQLKNFKYSCSLYFFIDEIIPCSYKTKVIRFSKYINLLKENGISYFANGNYINKYGIWHTDACSAYGKETLNDFLKSHKENYQYNFLFDKKKFDITNI